MKIEYVKANKISRKLKTRAALFSKYTNNKVYIKNNITKKYDKIYRRQKQLFSITLIRIKNHFENIPLSISIQQHIHVMCHAKCCICLLQSKYLSEFFKIYFIRKVLLKAS